MKKLTYDNLIFETFIEPTNSAILYIHGNGDIGEDLYRFVVDKSKLGLIVISGEDWNRDLTPWPAPAVFKQGDGFDGRADEYLEKLEKCMMDAEKTLGLNIVNRGIMGYSLAGLFAVYSLYRCDFFNMVASVSGSLWYDGFLEYIKARHMSTKPLAAYFSLGDKENKTKNTRMARVLDCTDETENWFSEQGIMTTFDINPGNHFNDEVDRVGKAIEYLEMIIRGVN